MALFTAENSFSVKIGPGEEISGSRNRRRSKTRRHPKMV